jgi:redox-sensitive bicupin YhaK (pirin superfamily)
MNPQSSRSVARVVPGIRTREGAGFEVRRPFPTHRLDHLDPFLLLDEMGPSDLGPGEARGAPDHPHRGFETVTYLLAGAMVHRDSHGNSGKLGPGDVQWMTAGAGVVHSEMPAPDFLRTGGRMHGFQLWVNLPRQDKMISPRYQDLPAARIPVVRTPDGVTAHVIAGEALGARAVVETRTPILYVHCTLAPGARTVLALPDGFDGFVYVFAGECAVGRDGQRIHSGEMAILSNDVNSVAFAAPPEAGTPAELLLIAGLPIGEPVVRYGPFVMNTQEEIVQAVQDYQNGRMGEIR